MQFINEMVTVMETTKKVLEAAYAQFSYSFIEYSESVEKLQELMDDIEDKKAGVSEMMDILTETPEDDVDDLERELAESMERDKMNGITYKDESPSISESISALPKAPTTIKRQIVEEEEEDLQASLDNLCSV